MRKYSVLTKSISHHVPEIKKRFCDMQMRCLMSNSADNTDQINFSK